MAINGQVRKIVAEDLNLGTSTISIQKADGTTVTANQININTIPSGNKIPVLTLEQFNDALSTLGSNEGTIEICAPLTLEADTTIPENVTLEFKQGCPITVPATVTLTINCGIIAGLYKIFDGDGTVTGSPKIEAVYPEWFGAKGDGVTDDSVAIQKSIDFALQNNCGVIYFGSEKYFLSNRITIIKNGEVDIEIRGNRYYNTKLLCSDNGGILINNELDDFSTYSDRVQQIFLKNLNIVNTNNSKAGYGVEIRNFGFIKLEKIFVNGWNVGFYIIDGSELDFWDCRSAGNTYGAKFIRTSGVKDLANTNIYSSRFHNNDNNTIIIDSVREINFIGCDLINNENSIEIRSSYLNTDYVGFISCDLENFNNIPAIKVGNVADANNINTVLFVGCLFALHSANKIEVNKTCNIKIIGGNGDYSVYPFIKVNNGYPIIENDHDSFLNILIADNTIPLNVIKPPYSFINYDNWDFRKGIVSPFVANTIYSYDTLNYVTGTGSIKFIADGTEKFISISCEISSGVLIDAIYQSGEENNVKVFLSDGSYVYAYQVGVEIKTQEFANGFIRKMIHIPASKLTGRYIKEIRLVTYSSTTDFLIDSVKIYTDDFISIKSGKSVLYNGAPPSGGNWKVGDIVLNTNPTIDANKMILLGWICTVDGDPGTWEPMYVSTVSPAV